jgi:hypothetical protein
MERRVSWIDVATLVGVMAPFLPFDWFLFRSYSLVGYLTDVDQLDASVMLVPPAFLPMFILVWLWRHRRSDDPTKPTWPVATRLLTVAAMVSTAVGTVGMQELLSEFSGLGWTAAFFLPIVANLGLWWRNHRRQLPLDATSEMLLLGTYVATALPWTLAFLTLAALYGAWLIAGICASYIVAIAMRLWGASQRLPGTSTTPR